MARGNRLLIGVLATVILSGAAAGFALDWAGRQGAASFLALATTALGVLCPSPLPSGGNAEGSEKGGSDASAG